jgi:hypothetical protein
VPVEVVVECTAAFPCGQPGCPICARPTVVCSPEPCAPVCAPVCPTKPRINRNVPGCIDECAFFQLNATVPQPVCAPICYRWAASRGTLVNATARDPIYFAPEVHLSCGEDVLITLTVVDAYGARYTDEIRLHVRNVP